MSNLKAEVSIDWADGTYTFRLTVLGTIELEQKCDAAFTVINQRLTSGTYKVADVRETIRLGLIGGGLKPEAALKLVRRYVDDRPLIESWIVARTVLAGVLFWFEVEPLTDGAPPGNPAAAPMTAPNVSTPPPSTETPRSSGARLSTLMTSRFGSSQQP